MNCLCVGGPVDGRRVVLPDGQAHYEVAELSLRVLMDVDTTIPAVMHRYSLFRLHPVTRGVVFAHESLTPTAIMEALMDGYRSETTNLEK